MALVVETGSGTNANVNSYLSLTDARALAASMGLSLYADDVAAEGALARAVTYIEGYREEFQGHPSEGISQPLSFPRKLVFINGVEFPTDEIPLVLKKAQVAAAALVSSGVELFVTDEGKFIVEETVDVITTKYSDKTIGRRTTYPEIETYLRPLLADLQGEWRRF